MPSTYVDYAALDTLLNDLDARALTGGTRVFPIGEECRRLRVRHPFRVSCIVRFLPGDSSTAAQIVGRTRNLSQNGLALLVRRVFAVGEPVEVEVHVVGRPKHFLAGLTSFCRYAGRGYHEVGVRLQTASPHPVFSDNPTEAIRVLDWLKGRWPALHTPSPQTARATV